LKNSDELPAIRYSLKEEMLTKFHAEQKQIKKEAEAA
jgi:hypothetical protein